jgi:hypothetical protein
LVWGFKFQPTKDVKFGLILELIMDVKLGMGFNLQWMWNMVCMGHKPTMDDNLLGLQANLAFLNKMRSWNTFSH